MITQNRKFKTENEKAEYVRKCDKNFDDKLSETAKLVSSMDGLKALTLSGPTCSGKTTTAKKLTECFEALNKDVHIISIDDFYYDRSVLNARADNDPDIEIDYDSFETIDFDAFCECVEEIFAYNKVHIPKYDFNLGVRSGYTEIDCEDDDLFVFEGIQAIYPQIREVLSKHSFKSIYVSVESKIKCSGQIFTPSEIRLYRRLVRDFNFRSAAPEFTLYLWESVRENEKKNILPYAGTADIVIDSAMPYDPNVIKPYLMNVLGCVPETSEYAEETRKIREKFEKIEEISGEYIAPTSLYKEFI